MNAVNFICIHPGFLLNSQVGSSEGESFDLRGLAFATIKLI